ncbi:MAG: hypothetical protein WA324_19020 [Bryobacteraceae bacterium]
MLSLVGVLAYSMPVLLGLVRGCRAEDITPEWIENFSVSTYSVMEGLLDDRDFDFLSRQSGFDLSLYRKLRKERLSIFSQYLKRLVLDFNRLYFSARVLIAHMPEDQSKAFEGLLMLKVRFSILVLKTQASYLLCLVGLQTLEVRSLLQNLEEMNGQFLQLAADQSPA